VAVAGGVMQRGPAAAGFHVDGGAPGNQLLDRRGVAVAGGVMQRGLAVAVFGVDDGAFSRASTAG
jgi:hypothetical protein